MSTVLVLGGSIRARASHREDILKLSKKVNDLNGFQNAVKNSVINRNEVDLCNSEILGAAALAGARLTNSTVDYFPLISLFPAKEGTVFELRNKCNSTYQAEIDTLRLDMVAFEELQNALDSAKGVILSTPVYFGDRSSVANKFLQIASVQNRMHNKIYGVVSVGAKRNGGQETCNVYSLYEMLNHRALCVGNGMPTSQYGGTAVGGDKGSVCNDDWGLHTGFGTGERVAHVSEILRQGIASTNNKVEVNITFILAMDTNDRRVRKHIDQLIEQCQKHFPHVKFSVLNLLKYNIFRCLGCKKCPYNKNEKDPKCIIRDPEDSLEEIRNVLSDIDGFIVCGVNPVEINEMITRYQVFTERMRFIRRNDYELSNKIVAGLCYHQFGGTVNPIHSIKVMTSYIRHNTIIHRPIEIFEYKYKVLDSWLSCLKDFCKNASIIKTGRIKHVAPQAVYNPYGEGGGYNKDKKIQNKGSIDEKC